MQAPGQKRVIINQYIFLNQRKRLNSTIKANLSQKSIINGFKNRSNKH